MPPKQNVTKDASSWMESVEPDDITLDHVLTSYRLNAKVCKPWGCKRNCRLNPCCLSGMGEKVWQESAELPEEKLDPCHILREPGGFVGLTNLGATCYVNSLLQLWFHNKAFRQALYDWVPDYDPQEQTNSSGSTNGELFIPSTSVGHLQQLFALMQFSRRKCLNPTSFIASLGLDTSTQQDAQEFSKLFISMLEGRLSYQFSPSVSTVIQKQFKGEYDYVTRCSGCMKEFSCPSPFYELDLSLGTKSQITLVESLLEYLKEEKLEGSNKYLCSVCGSKQNATRSIRLRTLPPVLNIQLLRFVFDRKSEMKKKVNSTLQFPEVLDMEPYVPQGNNQQSKVYDLQAVLIHRGPSAYSGHYIAQIRDPDTGTWYRFNDEEVGKIEGKSIKLGSEEDGDDGSSKKAKTPKTAKGMHSSSNAYMLVYCRRDDKPEEKEKSTESMTLDSLPLWLQNAINMDNENFEKWLQEKNQKRGETERLNQNKQENMMRLLKQLPCASLENSDLISFTWLSNWISGEEKLGPIDNQSIICRHGKVHPEKYKDFKCIADTVVGELYATYGGGPRLKTIESLCWDCIRLKCKEVRLRSQIDADFKTITELLKPKIEPSETTYWVGKESVRCWKRLALESLNDAGAETKDEEASQNDANSQQALEENPENKKVTNGQSSSSCNGGGDDTVTTESLTTPFQKEFLKSLQESHDTSPEELGFNDDILCQHRNLCIEESQRRLVPLTVWHLFRRYFPLAAEYKGTDRPCELCFQAASEEEKSKQLNRELAAKQRSALMDLFRGRNRPNLNNSSVFKVHIVTRDFVEEWRSFIREPAKRDRVAAVLNSTLLCNHGGLLHRLPATQDLPDSKFVYLWPSEWDVIEKEMLVDVAISAWKSEVDGRIQLTTCPGECRNCIASRLEEERRSQLHYSKAVVYIRLVNETDKIAASNNCADQQQQPPSPDQLAADPNADPAFQTAKKPRLDNAILQQQQQQARRSERQRRVRGGREVVVSSDQTVRDLKVQVMKVYGIAPFDQHLTFNGKDLLDNTATLASLEIYPGSEILLKADEVPNEGNALEDLASTAVPEEGFKGTELLRS